MAQAPNCGKIAARARLRRSHHLGQNKEDTAWNKTLETSKYPKCVGKKLFEDCPEEVLDEKNPPSRCKACPQFKPTAEILEERKKHMVELMALFKKT